jgi:hypothetical protein
MSMSPVNWLVSESITGTEEMLFFTRTYGYVRVVQHRRLIVSSCTAQRLSLLCQYAWRLASHGVHDRTQQQRAAHRGGSRKGACALMTSGMTAVEGTKMSLKSSGT